MKPHSGGMPISAMAATVKAANTSGMRRARPCICRVWVRPVCTITAPMQKNSVIFISPWQTMCISAPTCPAGVMMDAPSSM